MKLQLVVDGVVYTPADRVDVAAPEIDAPTKVGESLLLVARCDIDTGEQTVVADGERLAELTRGEDPVLTLFVPSIDVLLAGLASTDQTRWLRRRVEEF